MSSQEPLFDTRAFRRALGNFATGVTVVTATSPDGTRAGVTANSFNSVSLDPPLVLWSIDKRSSSLEVFQQASHFSVNILAADQIDLSNQFARPRDDKFAGVLYDMGVGATPLLHDCAASFVCEMHQLVDGGDHVIVIGKVLAFEDSGRSPLLYHQGVYSMLLPHTSMTQKVESRPASSVFQGRLAHNIYYLLTQAVRGYQVDYQPKQLSTGLRTSEARMLMVLENDAALGLFDLLREVAMPMREIEEAVANLKRKGLVADTQDRYVLTPSGMDQAEALWRIAREQQDKVFEEFSDEQLESFKQVLKTIIALN